ncbi:MAG: hypothetical protein ABF504_13260 [Komagataeibacter saccharivorans]|uniref:hypothetical protein n=1 Tax=Komagataeibacter saccharivorans TaxID=265959 RepID=UPI0039EBE304
MAAPHPAIRRKGLSSQVAFEQKLVLAPGVVFSVSGNADSCMRFNVAPLTDPHIRDRPDDAMKVAVAAAPAPRRNPDMPAADPSLTRK